LVPAFVQLVEENQPSISYQEQIPEHSEIRSIEAVNLFKEESNEEALTGNLEQAPISLRINSMDINTQVGQNVEKVRFLSKKNLSKRF
jgi:hypothetical protein